MSWGLIQLFTGDGRGKTSAALGTVLRAAARGKRIAIIFFDKGGDHYSERIILRDRFSEVELFATGTDRIDPESGTFRFGVTDADRSEGERGLQLMRRLFEDRRHDLIVLDEINSSAALGIVRVEDVVALLEKRPPRIELILTGRNAPDAFRQKADLITEMNAAEHYFNHGVPAREGLDF